MCPRGVENTKPKQTKIEQAMTMYAKKYRQLKFYFTPKLFDLK